MKRNILCILVGKRKDTAVNVQKILTAWGCLIKTRLGLHDGILEDCSESGVILLELVGEKDKIQELSRKLELLDDVHSELVELKL